MSNDELILQLQRELAEARELVGAAERQGLAAREKEHAADRRMLAAANEQLQLQIKNVNLLEKELATANERLREIDHLIPKGLAFEAMVKERDAALERIAELEAKCDSLRAEIEALEKERDTYHRAWIESSTRSNHLDAERGKSSLIEQLSESTVRISRSKRNVAAALAEVERLKKELVHTHSHRILDLQDKIAGKREELVSVVALAEIGQLEKELYKNHDITCPYADCKRPFWYVIEKNLNAESTRNVLAQEPPPPSYKELTAKLEKAELALTCITAHNSNAMNGLKLGFVAEAIKDMRESQATARAAIAAIAELRGKP